MAYFSIKFVESVKYQYITYEIAHIYYIMSAV